MIIDYNNFSKEELIKELQDLNFKFKSLKKSYESFEEDIEQSAEEKQFKTLVFDTTSFAISIADEEGIIRFANPAFINLWGYSKKEEVVGHPIPFFFNTSSDAFPVLDTLNKTGKWEGDFVAKKKDGTAFIAGGTAFASKNPDTGKFNYHSTLTDISEKRKFEEDLKENNLVLQLTLDFFPMAIGIINEDFNTKFFNKKFVETFGYTIEDVPNISKWWTLAYPDPDYRAKVADDWDRLTKKALEDKKPMENYFANVVCKDGSVKNIEFISSVIDKQNVVIFNDLTEKNKTAEIILQNEKRSKATIEAIPDILFYFDQHGVFLECLTSNPELLVMSKEAFIGKNIREVMPHNVANFTISAINSAFRTGELQYFEYELNTPTGLTFWEMRLTRSTETEALAFVRNITTRKRSEILIKEKNEEIYAQNEEFQQLNEELIQTNDELSLVMRKIEESEEKYRLIIANSPDLVLLQDAEGVTTYMSPQVEDIIGHKAERFIGKTMPADLIYHEDLPVCIDAFKKLQKGEIINKLEYRFYSSNKEIIWIQHTASPIYIDNEYKGIQNNIRNITKEKTLELELINAKTLAEENEKRYKLLFMNLNSNFALHEIIVNEEGKPYDYRFLAVNPVFEMATGLKAEDIIGKRCLELYPQTEQYWLDMFGEVASTGIPRLYENYSIELDRYFEMVIYSPCNGQFAFIGNDVTDRKRAEIELKQKNDEYLKLNEKLIQTNEELFSAKNLIELSEERYRLTVQNSNDAIVLINEKGEQIFISAIAEAITGYPTDETLGSFVEFIHPDDLAAVLIAWNKILITKDQPLHVQYRHKHKTKEWVWLEAVAQNYLDNPALNAVLLNVRDISLIKETVEELIRSIEKAEESEEKYKSMVSILPDGVVIHQKGIMKYVNPAAVKIIKGNSESDFIGKPLMDFVHPDERAGIMERIQKSLSSNTTAPPQEEKFIDVYGNSIPVYACGRPFIYDGELSMLVVFADITELKNIEKELINAKQKAEESDRLKSAFLANMSHEIRTPLNGILGFSQLLAEEGIQHDEQVRFTNIIKSCGNQLLNIINDILDIAKIEANQLTIDKKLVSINQLIRDTFNVFESKYASAGIELSYNVALDDENSFILTDSSRLQQVLSNLISNALKFTPKGKVKFGCQQNHDFIEFYVMDNGIGIDTSMQDRIFERFLQVESELSKNAGGTGLGLSISKAIIELLGGKIWVESEINCGSKFYFSIPYHKDKRADKSDLLNHKDITLKLNGHKTVLIAEDEDINYLYVYRILKDLNVNLIHVTNGSDAINVVKTNPNIDLVLMDIKMPKMNGNEATIEIRKFNKFIPIIAQTAYAQDSDRVLAIDSGCSDYISKPFTKDSFIKLLSKYLND